MAVSEQIQGRNHRLSPTLQGGFVPGVREYQRWRVSIGCEMLEALLRFFSTFRLAVCLLIGLFIFIFLFFTYNDILNDAEAINLEVMIQ